MGQKTSPTWAGSVKTLDQEEPLIPVDRSCRKGTPLPNRQYTRTSEFSYRCNGCGRCCRNKRIQTSPYEVLRLARNLELSTGEFLIRYIDAEGPYLRAVEGGACVFLVNKGCGVHKDRPLACRTYPLGLYVSPQGEETFLELNPHPQTEGVYGCGGTVDQYLNQQGAQPYIDAGRRYMALFYRLHEALHQTMSPQADAAGELQSAIAARDEGGLPAFTRWFDVDSMVAKYCKSLGIAVPVATGELVKLHIQSIEHVLDTNNGGER
ncbi:MAG: YkgJ family cysteine cluster protein [Desulfovibrionales bacterium]